MRTLATGDLVFGLPNALIVWAVVGAGTIFLLNRTTFGRAVYGIGNRERAAYLSGIDTQRIVLIAFAIAGGLSAFGGVLLAGYASKAAQAMGDAYLLPAIASVVLGGASILGGRGSYYGTIAGVILITLLQSILSVVQMPEAGRQIIYGVVIIAMLLLYGRGKSDAIATIRRLRPPPAVALHRSDRRWGRFSSARADRRSASGWRGPARGRAGARHRSGTLNSSRSATSSFFSRPAATCGSTMWTGMLHHPNPARRKSRRVERSAKRQIWRLMIPPEKFWVSGRAVRQDELHMRLERLARSASRAARPADGPPQPPAT